VQKRMVRRNLNTPAGTKIRNFPVEWLREIGVEWFCTQCAKPQPRGSVSVEFFVRVAIKANKDELEELKKMKSFNGQKKYLCLDCAIEHYESAMQDAKLIKVQGVDAFLMVKKL